MESIQNWKDEFRLKLDSELKLEKEGSALIGKIGQYLINISDLYQQKNDDVELISLHGKFIDNLNAIFPLVNELVAPSVIYSKFQIKKSLFDALLWIIDNLKSSISDLSNHAENHDESLYYEEISNIMSKLLVLKKFFPVSDDVTKILDNFANKLYEIIDDKFLTEQECKYQLFIIILKTNINENDIVSLFFKHALLVSMFIPYSPIIRESFLEIFSKYEFDFIDVCKYLGLSFNDDGGVFDIGFRYICRVFSLIEEMLDSGVIFTCSKPDVLYKLIHCFVDSDRRLYPKSYHKELHEFPSSFHFLLEKLDNVKLSYYIPNFSYDEYCGLLENLLKHCEDGIRRSLKRYMQNFIKKIDKGQGLGVYAPDMQKLVEDFPVKSLLSRDWKRKVKPSEFEENKSGFIEALEACDGKINDQGFSSITYILKTNGIVLDDLKYLIEYLKSKGMTLIDITIVNLSSTLITYTTARNFLNSVKENYVAHNLEQDSSEVQQPIGQLDTVTSVGISSAPALSC